MADQTEFQSVLDAAVASAGPDFDVGKSGQFALLPEGFTVQSLEKFQAVPNQITADHRFGDVRSLAAYLNVFANEQTMIVADFDRAVVRSQIDGDGVGNPSHKTHSATFVARRHEKIEAWLAVCGKPMTQTEFGLFLEDRAVDVVDPEAADIMDMVMTFDATKKVTFKSSTRLHDGSRQFQYVEENDARGGLTLPDHVVILAPVYRGMDPQRITFKLRYRINDGALRFNVEMQDKDEVLRAAFERCIDALRADLKSDPIIYTAA